MFTYNMCPKLLCVMTDLDFNKLLGTELRHDKQPGNFMLIYYWVNDYLASTISIDDY